MDKTEVERCLEKTPSRGPHCKNGILCGSRTVAARFLITAIKRGAGWLTTAKDRGEATVRGEKLLGVLSDGFEKSHVVRS